MALEITVKVVLYLAAAFIALVATCWLDDVLGKWWNK